MIVKEFIERFENGFERDTLFYVKINFFIGRRRALYFSLSELKQYDDLSVVSLNFKNNVLELYYNGNREDFDSLLLEEVFKNI